jgi:hypothetical protein
VSGRRIQDARCHAMQCFIWDEDRFDSLFEVSRSRTAGACRAACLLIDHICVLAPLEGSNSAILPVLRLHICCIVERGSGEKFGNAHGAKRKSQMALLEGGIAHARLCKVTGGRIWEMRSSKPPTGLRALGRPKRRTASLVGALQQATPVYNGG